MSRVVSRIQQLIALATNDHAAAEEARTAARIAARLIHGHGIELKDPAETSTAPPPPKTIRSRYAGRCIVCGRDYNVGDTVKWTKGRGTAHVKCGDT
jgi:hypothetical protein